MQVFLHLNGQTDGPHTLPRVSAKLGSGEVPPETLAWREGLDNWYPLHDARWAEVGIVATAPSPVVEPEPAPVPAPEPESEPVPEPTPAEPAPPAEPVPEEVPEETAFSPDEPVPQEGPAPEVSLEPESPPEPEPKPESAFAAYSEEDFKPLSFEEMDKEMISLREERKLLPVLIGEKAFDAGIEAEEIEEARVAVATAREKGDPAALVTAHVAFGQAILATGIHDPAIEELRDCEHDLADRMLSLQVQARRTGARGKKKRGGWLKWILLLLALVVVGGAIAAFTGHLPGIGDDRLRDEGRLR